MSACAVNGEVGPSEALNTAVRMDAGNLHITTEIIL